MAADSNQRGISAFDRQRLGLAWMVLALVLALHVADEAVHDFLAFYHPVAREIRAQLPWLPVPDFSFTLWLTGLIALTLILLALSHFAFAAGRVMRACAYVFAAIMAANGGLHFAGSLHFNQLLPGTLTAPLLVAASAWLYVATRRATPGHHEPLT
jgi:hypothetical protein